LPGSFGSMHNGGCSLGSEQFERGKE